MIRTPDNFELDGEASVHEITKTNRKYGLLAWLRIILYMPIPLFVLQSNKLFEINQPFTTIFAALNPGTRVENNSLLVTIR